MNGGQLLCVCVCGWMDGWWNSQAYVIMSTINIFFDTLLGHTCNHWYTYKSGYMYVYTVHIYTTSAALMKIVHLYALRSLMDKSGETSKWPKISIPPQPLPQSFQELPDHLQSVLPSDYYLYHVETFEELLKSTFLGAPTACFKTKFYIKLDTEVYSSTSMASKIWGQKSHYLLHSKKL